jgi:hypothetical protein
MGLRLRFRQLTWAWAAVGFLALVAYALLLYLTVIRDWALFAAVAASVLVIVFITKPRWDQARGKAAAARQKKHQQRHRLPISLIVLVAVTVPFAVYAKQTVLPPSAQQLYISGGAELFVSNPSVKATMTVSIDPTGGGSPCADWGGSTGNSAKLPKDSITSTLEMIRLDFYGFKADTKHPAQFLLVMISDARIARQSLYVSEGPAPATYPPQLTLPTQYQNEAWNLTQLITGPVNSRSSDQGLVNGVLIAGCLTRPIESIGGPTVIDSLPYYGDADPDAEPLLKFAPRLPQILVGSSFDNAKPFRGINWYAPTEYNVQVTLTSPAAQETNRFDSVSPTTPTKNGVDLTWNSDSVVRPYLVSTNIQADANERNETFVLGIILGALISGIITLLAPVLDQMNMRNGKTSTRNSAPARAPRPRSTPRYRTPRKRRLPGQPGGYRRRPRYRPKGF